MSSTQPRPASTSDQSVELALTVLSFPAASTAHRPSSRPSSPALSASHQDDSSPSSFGSWVDLPSVTNSDHDSRPTHQVQASRRRRKMNRGIRSGLSNLPTPPSPFGTQLQPVTPRSTPYYHIHRHNTRFTPHPTPRALEVENDRIPRPEPDEVYDTFLSAVESFKRLAAEWGGVAANVITHGGKKDLTGQMMKIGLGVVCVMRPGWVLGVMNTSWRVLRDPWRSYHHAVYSAFIARVLFS